MQKLILNLIDTIRKSSPKSSTKLVAIDGRGGSGKSTLAKKLSELSENSSDSKFKIISTDSFPYSPDIIPWNEYDSTKRLSLQDKVNSIFIDLVYVFIP